MKTSVKLSGLATEVENLCIDLEYDFNESFDHQFAEIRREIETLESRITVFSDEFLNSIPLKDHLKSRPFDEILKEESSDSDKRGAKR